MFSLSKHMELMFEGRKRKTLLEPAYKRIDSNGKVYLDKKLEGREVLIIPLEPMAGDKERFIKVGRSSIQLRDKHVKID